MTAPAAPTERQLHYLRALAARTATTFAKPTTRRQASREIDRLVALTRSQAALPDDSDWREGEQTEYATAVQPDEVTGFGSSARWRSQPHARPPSAPDRGPEGPVRLRSYRVSAGKRIVIAQRTGDQVCVRDIPARGDGVSYPVEQLSASEGVQALRALLADYLDRASELDEIPMAPGALTQILGSGASR
jgi:hypothetical protein